MSRKFLLPFFLVMTFLSIILGGCSTAEWSPPPAASVPASNTPVPTVTASPQPTPTDKLTEARDSARKTAENFILNSSTFKFDGIEGSLKFVKDDPGVTSSFMSWSFTFEFQNRHPGYGDRTGQVLAQVIASHRAAILVNLEKGTVSTATLDNAWDMLTEKDLPVYVRGTAINGGDTTSFGGPLDAPRQFIYKVLQDEGNIINISYIAYPPSPVGNAARAKITLDFYNGSINAGDRIEARGTLDKASNTVVVEEQGDYIRTTLHKVTILGVVVNIIDSPEQTMYELLRDDGTFIYVSHQNKEGTPVSLYNQAIQVGDFMKAVGTYDIRTNTISVSAPDDMLKTYDHNPIVTKAMWE